MSVSEALGKIALKATLFMRILEIFTKREQIFLRKGHEIYDQNIFKYG